MNESRLKIREDFDQIALLPERGGWDHNNHYHNFLLKQIPSHCQYALDVGCGKGMFARLLAERADHVTALDLSPNMIRIAIERSERYANIDFVVVDAIEWDFPVDQFDCIASLATLHHLPLEKILSRMKGTLRVNGVLIVLDLFQGTLSDKLGDFLAVPANILMNLLRNGIHIHRGPKNSREVWAEHGKHDSYLTLKQIRQICHSVLPGAKVRKHLFWRYSIVWQKLPY